MNVYVFPESSARQLNETSDVAAKNSRLDMVHDAKITADVVIRKSVRFEVDVACKGILDTFGCRQEVRDICSPSPEGDQRIPWSPPPPLPCHEEAREGMAYASPRMVVDQWVTRGPTGLPFQEMSCGLREQTIFDHGNAKLISADRWQHRKIGDMSDTFRAQASSLHSLMIEWRTCPCRTKELSELDHLGMFQSVRSEAIGRKHCREIVIGTRAMDPFERSMGQSVKTPQGCLKAPRSSSCQRPCLLMVTLLRIWILESALRQSLSRR